MLDTRFVSKCSDNQIPWIVAWDICLMLPIPPSVDETPPGWRACIFVSYFFFFKQNIMYPFKGVTPVHCLLFLNVTVILLKAISISCRVFWQSESESTQCSDSLWLYELSGVVMAIDFCSVGNARFSFMQSKVIAIMTTSIGTYVTDFSKT